MTGPEGGPGRAPLLPDLAHVDLRTLRAMNDPRLAEAVDRVLGYSSELSETWYTGDDGTDTDRDRAAVADRMFPARSGVSPHGEERTG
ncbi:hypothetical protein ACFQ7F_11945 [Streptomyces sp. NPDC056486]|uniref:hypothetical protein n=1 Tax=Streptomyces sp. NPDC056486 TaxID=3345835 RepID=UPI0036C1AC91